jgi:hypothetical protein
VVVVVWASEAHTFTYIHTSLAVQCNSDIDSSRDILYIECVRVNVNVNVNVTASFARRASATQ